MSEEKKQQAFITEQSNLEDLPDSTEEEEAKKLQPEASVSRQSGETTEGEYYEDDRSKDYDGNDFH